MPYTMPYVYDIVYDTIYDVVCTMSFTHIVNNIYCCSILIVPLLQDTLCLVAPYPFRLEPLEDFDPLVDFDMTGGDDVWFAPPQLFFTCSFCPNGRSQDKSSHREVSLVTV
jgi:hypothetical protein